MEDKRRCDVMSNHADAVQDEIGYPEVRRQLEAYRASSRVGLIASVTRIPVVVHVLFFDEEQNISDQQIEEQISVLNEDFRATNADLQYTPEVFRPLVSDARIEFSLAIRDPSGRPTNGVVRTKTSVQEFPKASVPINKSRSSVIDAEVKRSPFGSVAWPRDEYLNIWVCNMGKNPLGYAAFPGAAAWRDGVVIDYSCFGLSGSAKSPFDRGRTTTHEIGHWLDLLHIWGDDNNRCTHSDSIADTPNQAGPNYRSPTFPSVSCSNGPNGDLFVNYMDYVDDTSMCMFTKDQVGRMHSALQGPRSSILRSKGLDMPDVSNLPESDMAMMSRAAYPDRHIEIEEIFDGVSWVSTEN